MSDMFREQLLKAGIVSKKQAKAAAHEENVFRRKRKKSKEGGDAPESTAAQEALEEKRARDRELNRARVAEKEAQALVAQVNDLVRQNTQHGWAGPVEYRFSDGGKVKTLWVTAACQKDLRDGVVGIARGEDGYAVVPRDTAFKIEARLPDRLLLLNEPEAPLADDDPYAEFPVPDDLMW